MKVSPDDTAHLQRLGTTRLALKRLTDNLIFILPRRYFKENRIDVECTSCSGHYSKDYFAPVNRQFQSATRKLAFGGYEDEQGRESKNPSLDNFYNNTTLSAVAKLFSAVIITVAFVLLIRRVVSIYHVVE